MSGFRKHWYLTVFSLLLLALLLSACSAEKREKSSAPISKTESVKVRVQAPLAPPSIPLIPMLQEQNIQIKWYQGMDEAMSRIMRDEVDISVLPVNSMSVLFNKGVDIQMGAVTTWGILYLVSSDPKINDWQDLKGKTVAVGARGFSPDLVFRSLLAKNGLKVGTDVQILYGTSPELAQLLLAEKISMAVLPEPLLTSVINQNPDIKIVLNLEKEWEKAFPDVHGLPQAGLSVSKKFAGEHYELWQQFSQNYAQNLTAYMNNHDKAFDLEAQVLKLPAKVIKASLSRSNLQFKTAEQAKESVQSYLEQLQLIDAEAIGEKLPDQQSDFYLKTP